MVESRPKDQTIIMLHKNKDFTQPLLIREIEIIVNRLVTAFNDMGADFPLFDKTTELPQLESGTWNRVLVLNDADIGLTTFENTQMLCLWIRLKQTKA